MRADPSHQSAPAGQRQARLDAAANIVTIAVGLAVLLGVSLQFLEPVVTGNVRPPDITVPEEPISIKGAAMLGSPAAKVVLVEYLDFQCPYCRRFARSVLPALRTKYVETNKLLLVFRHFPLPGHSLAEAAAESAACADQQGKFLEAYEAFFGNAQLEETIRRLPASLNLAEDRFAACLTGVAKQQVQDDVTGAASMKIASTPVFLIGTIEVDRRVRVREIVRGARPLADFERSIDEALRVVGAAATR